MGEDLKAGAYESLHTAALSAEVARTTFTPRYAEVSSATAPEVLARHVAAAVTTTLATITDADTRIATVNNLLAQLSGTADPVLALEQLITLTEQVSAGVHRLVPVPTIKLSDVALLTNAKDQPNLGASLSSEMGSADRVDLLCAFIKFSGIRIIRGQLLELRERGVPFRVITTTYMGATERRAVDQLVRELGAEVKISYNSRSTRLHAKAWLFHRESGFDTGFIGSSNLSRAAMVDGLEWNVRISSVATPTLVRQFTAAFDTYWNDPAFQPYSPDVDASRLDEALADADSGEPGAGTLTLSGLQVRAYPHQEQMLESLDVERKVHGRHRNLLVAATGTGKTVVAALDYQRLCGEGERLSLLFVAHRKEILTQSLRTYREVLADGAFGELYVDGLRPTQWRHVFASVQALSGEWLASLKPEQFAVVVVDEFHHAEASTYRRFLAHFKPAELLGLTATPERSDGVDVREFFDGRTAHELRLWDALEDDLLCPFHYYGVADGTDLSKVEWKRGAYDLAGLSNVYTGNDSRAAKVLNALRDTVVDPTRIRALGFCVSVAHAEYMARVFTEAGLPSRAVSAETHREQRADAFNALRAGEVRCLFAALAHVDDPERAGAYRLLSSAGAPDYESLTEREQHLARMLFFTLWPNKGGFSSFSQGLASLREHPAVGEEVSQLMDVVLEQIRHVPRALNPSLAHLPLLSHATYRREEILAGINWASWDRSARGNITGVAWSDVEHVDALMINLHKDEAGFSPTTMYRDYPVSRELFHWESQNATSTTSPAGRRYLSRTASTLLFVRDRPINELGTAPFLCLGAADYLEHRGERPIAITWKLQRSMPTQVLQSAAVVAG